MTPNARQEGFWSVDKMPKAHIKPFQDKVAVLTALNVAEGRAEDKRYRGFSLCRCCQTPNGNGEFTLKYGNDTWVWPSGFRHYVDAHNVRPSQPFIDFILRFAEKERHA